MALALRKNRLKIIFGGLLLITLTVVAFLLGLLNLETQVYLMIGWAIFMIVLLWAGNTLISKLLNRWFPWLQYGNLRFFVQLLATLVYSLIIINSSYYLFKTIFTQDPPILSQIVATNVFGLFIVLPFASIYFGVHFLRSWRKSEIEAEKFQKESVESQLVALKNHLDPHFLFNNLNILSSLIEKDPKLSQSYLDKFAEVYRVILQANTTDPVPLSKELDFVEAYMYLLKIRFEDGIKLEMDLPQELKHKMLPPLTLQMLLENVIKHNMVTETKPLQIRVYSEDNYLIVENNLQPKKIRQPSGSGLKNIMMRYSYFTDQEVVKEESEEKFIIKVPLIEIEEV